MANKKRDIIPYEINDDLEYEINSNEYHVNKTYGNWYSAKLIVSSNWNDKKMSVFLWDYLEKLFEECDDSFDNILGVYYKSNLDIDIVYDFEAVVGKYLIDNIM
mgnify:CR=1 FL=1